MENKKQILLIAPLFFGYYKEVIKELELLGYEVDFFCDSANNSSFFKALSRISKKSVQLPMRNYYKNAILPKITAKKYDYVFFIVAMTFSFSPEIIKDLREKQSKAKFVIYQWDGEKNLPFVKDIHQFFDSIYTFDRIDASKNSAYKFFPLFYIRNYEEIGNEINKTFKYDVSYIGTAHPQKLYWINKMSNELKGVFQKQYIYHFLPSRLKYLYHKVRNKEYKSYNLKYFNYEKLLTQEIMQIFKDSKCILDAPQEGQNGLTIRTMECLGAKKKLITKNKDIINYDFYCPENILVFDENVNTNDVFFQSEYKEIPEEIYRKYSLREWIRKILERLGD